MPKLSEAELLARDAERDLGAELLESIRELRALRYPAKFEAAPERGFVVTFRDIPEAITQGETEVEAMERAGDVLMSSMDFYFKDQRPVPMPSRAQNGELLVELPPSVTAKVLRINEKLTA